METANSINSKSSIVFIDSNVSDYQLLVNGVNQGIETRVIDAHENGIEQITIQLQDFFAKHGLIDEIHILSHGNPGCIYLGSTILNVETLAQNSHQFQEWQKFLNKQANLLLYGCKIAADFGGNFVQNLAQLTHTHIAAATELIGNIDIYSNWNLDFSTGKITAIAPFSATTMANYQGVLATIAVTNTNDSGTGSLRQAIANAAAGDTIAFASNLANQTITLTTGQLTINKNLTIDGGGAANLTISGNNASRVFEVPALQATFRNLIIANGRVNGNTELSAGGGIKTGDSGTILTVDNCRFNNNVAGHGGGAIFSGFKGNATVTNSKFNGNIGTGGNTERGGGAIATKSAGSLVVKGSEFTNNKGINGGAINSLLGTLTVENSIFKNNDTTAGSSGNGTMGYGGAIYTDGANASGANSLPGPIGGTITIRNSQFDGNIGAGQGGAMFLFGYSGDKVIVDKSTVINNKIIKDGTNNALGGGIRIGVDNFTITNTTIANNTALSQGGGLWVGENSKGSITNSTLSGNKADDGQGNGLGGAIAFINGSNPVSVTNTTIAYNSAGFMGGAFWGGGNNITLTNTIVGYSTAGNPWGVKINTGSQFSDGGSNLQWPPKKSTDPSDMNITSSPSLIIADPKLDPTLKDNGGGLLTHALLTGSPAINTGKITTLTTDERGFTRDSKPDIGAVEFGTNGVSNPGISITQSGGNTNVTEGGTTDSYAVVLNSQPTANVNVAINKGTQLSTNLSQLVFTPQNWNIAQSVTVTAVNDQVAEGNQTTTIQHTATSTDTKYNNIVISSVNVGITDNDIAKVNITQTGGNTNVTEGGVTDSYTVILNSQPTANVTLAINKGTQLSTNLSQLVFTPLNWNVAQNVTVTAVNDTIIERTKTAAIKHTVTSSDTKYNAIIVGSVNAKITDNDPGLVITQSGGNTNVTEGGTTDSYSVFLSTQPTANVNVAINQGTQLTTNLSQLVFTPLNWNVAQNVTVTAVNDTLVEGNHSGTIRHTATSTDTKYNNIVISSVNVGITDNPSSLTLTGTSSNDILIGGANNDILTGAGGKDTLTGGLGSDKFVYQNLTDSLLANFDVITDFNATTGNDLFRVSTARAGFVNVAAVNTLDAAGIGVKLTNTAFGSNFAAQFSFGQRNLVAINDAKAGFNASTDSIIEVTGFTGIFSINNFTIL